jgi:RimJ/RimL family protein N-acetyltransferase
MVGDELVIRAATAADAETLARFQEEMALETEGRHLVPQRVRAGVAAVLADPARGRYLVAERAGRAAGALLLTTEWSDWRAGEFWWIQSVFVPRAERRRGVYAALHRHVEREARSTPGIVGLRLYVESENEAARRVYSALGMEVTGYRLYEVDFQAGPGPSQGSK